MKYIPPSSLAGKVAVFAKKQKYWFIVGLVIALFLYVISYLPEYIDKTTPPQNRVQVLVAADDIDQYTEIKKDQLGTVGFLEDSTPLNAMTAADRTALIGKAAAIHIKRGDVITRTMVMDGNTTATQNLSQNIPTDKKAFFLKTTDLQTPIQGLEVKDRIDIIGFDIQGKTTKNTVGILKNATILDIRNSAKGDSVYVLGLNDGEIVALNDALANKWYLQAVLLHRDAAKTTGKLIR